MNAFFVIIDLVLGALWMVLAFATFGLVSLLKTAAYVVVAMLFVVLGVLGIVGEL